MTEFEFRVLAAGHEGFLIECVRVGRTDSKTNQDLGIDFDAMIIKMCSIFRIPFEDWSPTYELIKIYLLGEKNETT